ncbi:MAG TPA: oligoendopeptidase F [Clostridiaceae bacterium]|nr:oligoendopeptidase F [Clostridiaceae bacterium]
MNQFDFSKNWQRSEIPEQATWDLTVLFSSDEAWEKAYTDFKGKITDADFYAGKLAESAELLLAAFQHSEQLSREAEKLMQYAHLKHDQDRADATYLAMYSRISQSCSQLSGKLAFMKPELTAMDSEVIEGFLQENAELQLYKKFFKDIARNKAHTLSEKEEILLAKAGDVFDAGANVFSIFSNADLKFPKVKIEKDNKTRITQSNYISLMENRQRKIRKKTFKKYFKTYQKFENTLALTLQNQIKQHNYLAEIYGHDNARAAALFANAIPETVYDQLLNTVSKNISLLHRYVRIRKEALGLKSLHCYDLYTPMVADVDFKYTPAEAQDLVIKALQPLGDEYIQVIEKAFAERWIDWFPSQGKYSGGYSSGIYDSKPYILLNWQGSLNSVYTLIHELGHSAHTYFSNRKQPYLYSGYSIFLAEIASTTNENLLTDYLLNNETDPERRRYIINHYLNGFKATMFRQTQFAKFEHLIHQAEQQGIPLTADYLNQEYLRINHEFYGPNLISDPEISLEWMRIPHFYFNYYVYQYATGFSAATTFAKKILENDQEVIKNYLNFLKSGSSDYPIETLAAAGLDMTKAEPIEQALETFAHYMDLFEK